MKNKEIKDKWKIVSKWEFTEKKLFNKYSTLVIIILQNLNTGEIDIKKVFSGIYSERRDLLKNETKL